jgi:hypothetical protein
MDDLMVFQAVEKVLMNDSRLNENNILTDGVEISPLMKDGHIDLLWRVTDRGEKKNVLIEIKNRLDIIDVGTITKFCKSVLENLLENKCAILLYTSQMTKEALHLCSEKNIIPIKIKEPTNEDWKGRIREIHIHMKMILPNFKNFKINTDIDKTKELLKRANKNEFKYNFSGKAADMIFYNKNNEPKITLENLLREYQQNIDLISNELKDHVTHQFEDTMYFPSEIGLIPINSIEFDREIHSISHPIVVDSSKNMGFAIGFSIVREVITKHIPMLEAR